MAARKESSAAVRQSVGGKRRDSGPKHENRAAQHSHSGSDGFATVQLKSQSAVSVELYHDVPAINRIVLSPK